MEATRPATSAGKPGSGNCPPGCVLHPGRIQCVAGLVVFESDGIYHDNATR